MYTNHKVGQAFEYWETVIKGTQKPITLTFVVTNIQRVILEFRVLNFSFQFILLNIRPCNFKLFPLNQQVCQMMQCLDSCSCTVCLRDRMNHLPSIACCEFTQRLIVNCGLKTERGNSVQRRERCCLNMQFAHSSVTSFSCSEISNGSGALPLEFLHSTAPLQISSSHPCQTLSSWASQKKGSYKLLFWALVQKADKCINDTKILI